MPRDVMSNIIFVYTVTSHLISPQDVQSKNRL